MDTIVCVAGPFFSFIILFFLCCCDSFFFLSEMKCFKHVNLIFVYYYLFLFFLIILLGKIGRESRDGLHLRRDVGRRRSRRHAGLLPGKPDGVQLRHGPTGFARS